MQELHATAHEIRILMSFATKLAGQGVEQRLHASGVPISLLQHGVMRILSREQHTISEVSRKMMLTPATLVPAIDALERHGYVARGHDPHDRRRTPLALTELGADILARVPAVDDDDVLVKSLGKFTHAERAQLLALVRRLVSEMLDSEDIVVELCQALRASD